MTVIECCCIQAGEDSDYSKTAKVELKKLFSGKMVRNTLAHLINM